MAILRFSRPDGSTATVFRQPGGSGLVTPVCATGRAPRRAPASGTCWNAGCRGRGTGNSPRIAVRGAARSGSWRSCGPTGWRRAISSSSTIATATARAEFDLFGGGRSWLGPSWTIDGEAADDIAPKPTSWISSNAAGLAEWSYRAGDARITQTALLLRGRRLALLTVLFEDRSALTRDLQVRIWSAGRDCGGTGRGLPRHPADRAEEAGWSAGAADRAALPVVPQRSRRVSGPGRRTRPEARLGRPALLAAAARFVGPATQPQRLQWRVLTVSERSRIVPPDRAFAARVSWGRDETYVIYRSLAPPASRAFLGYQTRARFLVGSFTTARGRRADSEGRLESGGRDRTWWAATVSCTIEVDPASPHVAPRGRGDRRPGTSRCRSRRRRR